jgi:hypothetical protein
VGIPTRISWKTAERKNTIILAIFGDQPLLIRGE